MESEQLKNRDISEQNTIGSAVPLKTIIFCLYRPGLWEQDLFKSVLCMSWTVSELTQTQADFERLGLIKPFQFLISGRHYELWKDPSSLNMSSSGLSHKNLLVPLLVSKHSVSLVSLYSYIVYLNLLSALLFPICLSFFLAVNPNFSVFMPALSPPLFMLSISFYSRYYFYSISNYF